MAPRKRCRDVIFLFALISGFVVGEAKDNITIYQKLRDDTDLSEFFALLDGNVVANTTIEYRSVTIFAPLNFAFQKYSKDIDDNSLALYYITNSALTLNQLDNAPIFSEQDGNPPLWVTRTEINNNKEIFINNARIVQQRSDLVRNSNSGLKQVLHVLEGVLEPIRAKSRHFQLRNPNAFDFINISDNLDLDGHNVRSFRQRVNNTQKRDIFDSPGKFTFFIPVDEGFQPPPRPDKIDPKVIDGHVIPNKVLFTSATLDDEEYQTLAYTDNLKVIVYFGTETDGKESKRFVASRTIVGDSSHPTGVVLSEIVKANIPVRNGVVHLIHRPLMVVDNTVTEFLKSFENHKDGPLYQFYKVILDAEGDFMDRITGMKELTLFAPSNNAWKALSLNNIIRDKKKMQEILHMHVVERKLSLDQIIANNKQRLLQEPTIDPRRQVYFNVVKSGGNKTLTVEGGGVNATVIQPDIAATNGIVHIIDRVLGVPFTTVGRKLATDPMMNKTYIMGKYQGFNDQLDDEKKRFTYFVPRDFAWNRVETIFPSAHKKLFMHDYRYHAKQILERHLVVADKAYTMAELKNMTLRGAERVPTVRDVVKLKVKENNKLYYVEWNNEWIYVYRPDVECTNGIIHVIDFVFIRDSDIQVTGSGEIVQPFRATLGFIICLIISQYL